MPDVALVCGGGGVLGSAIVRALLDRGDRVVSVERRVRDDDAPDGLRREAVDLTSADEVEALWDRLAADGETPRWVANVAGGFSSGGVGDSSPESLQASINLNLGTAWWSSREAARRLPEGGAIVNVSSRAAVSGGARSAAYSVGKAAVVRLTEVFAADLAARRVRVNAILPAVIDTPANRESMSADALAKAVAPAELASVVSFLLSDAAAAITGAIIPAYGFA
jgi:NAD(P)-dependent dehydrogenase (short-subunit alcohol dehydrogenase family)